MGKAEGAKEVVETTKTILELEDNKVNRGLLLIFSIFSPMGLTYIFFHDRIGKLGAYGFILLVLGFSPFLLVLYIRSHFFKVKYMQFNQMKDECLHEKLERIMLESNSVYSKTSDVKNKAIDVIKKYSIELSEEDLDAIKRFTELEKSSPDQKKVESEIQMLRERRAILDYDLKKSESTYLVEVLSDFLFYFLFIFLILISIDLFLSEIAFPMFIFLILLFFILVIGLDNFQFKHKLDKMSNALERNIEVLDMSHENLKNQIKDLEELYQEKVKLFENTKPSKKKR